MSLNRRVLAGIALAVLLSACGRKPIGPEAFFGTANAIDLGGKSAADISEVLGAPSATQNTQFGEQRTFSNGQVEIVFVDGTSSLLRLKPATAIEFAPGSLSVIGFQSQPSDEGDSRRLVWRSLPNTREVTFISRDGSNISTAVVDFDGRVAAAREAASQAAAAQTFSPAGVDGVPPIKRDLQDECLRVLALLEQVFIYDLAEGEPKAFVDLATAAESAALGLQDKLSASDPRRDLVVNAAQSLQGLVISLAAGNPTTSPEVERILVSGRARLGMLSAILNDNFTPEGKVLFETWLREAN